MQRKHSRAIGQRIATAGIGAICAAFFSQPIMAQSDAETLSDLRACGDVARDRARLACFDGVLAAEREGGGFDEEPLAQAEPENAPREPEPVSIEAAPEPEPAVASAAAGFEAVDETADETVDETARLDNERVEEAVPEPAEEAPVAVAAAVVREPDPEPAPAIAAPVPPPAEASAARDDEPVSLARRRAPPPEAEEPVVITIVDARPDPPGSARFLTEAGELLIQTSGGTLNRWDIPDVPFEANVETGALGSMFLSLGDRRRIRVRLASR